VEVATMVGIAVDVAEATGVSDATGAATVSVGFTVMPAVGVVCPQAVMSADEKMAHMSKFLGFTGYISSFKK
jgi:hypothetical protein